MKENKLKKLNYELLELYKKSFPILIKRDREFTKYVKEHREEINKKFKIS